MADLKELAEKSDDSAVPSPLLSSPPKQDSSSSNSRSGEAAQLGAPADVDPEPAEHAEHTAPATPIVEPPAPADLPQPAAPAALLQPAAPTCLPAEPAAAGLPEPAAQPGSETGQPELATPAIEAQPGTPPGTPPATPAEQQELTPAVEGLPEPAAQPGAATGQPERAAPAIDAQLGTPPGTPPGTPAEQLELKQGSFQLLPPVRLNPMLEMAEMVEIFLSSRLLAKMQDQVPRVFKCQPLNPSLPHKAFKCQPLNPILPSRPLSVNL